MEKGSSLNWPKLAQDLGFYDQAHFIKTFKAMIGKSPEEYVREAGIL
ncbi:helix-turn-helix domain-containing protein [Paenibacillus sp. P26]|nr:helix-turn-helix domain-containing protein [Paenibacillus sp. P26]